MARLRPVYALAEIERGLGYSIDSLNYPHDAAKRLYGDLSPVPESADERARREVEERAKHGLHKYTHIPGRFPRVVGVPQVSRTIPPRAHDQKLTNSSTIAYGRDTMMTFTCQSLIGHYNFTADIQFGFGLDLSLMLTEREAMVAIAASKVSFLWGDLSYVESMFSCNLTLFVDWVLCSLRSQKRSGNRYTILRSLEESGKL